MAAAVLLAATGTGAAAQDTGPNDHRPVLSPDGAHLAFMSDRDGTRAIWVMEAEGPPRPRRISAHPMGEWYPDWSPDGTHEQRMTDSPEHEHDPAISPDGSDPRPLDTGGSAP